MHRSLRQAAAKVRDNDAGFMNGRQLFCGYLVAHADDIMHVVVTGWLLFTAKPSSPLRVGAWALVSAVFSRSCQSTFELKSLPIGVAIQTALRRIYDVRAYTLYL